MWSRPWAGWADLARMQTLAGTSLLEAPARTFIHPGDLAWWLGWWPKTTEEFAAIVQIWEVDGDMAAWVVDDTGYIGECIAPSSLDDEVLIASMDGWIDARLRGHVRSARDDDPVGIARLASAGYRRVPDDMVAFSLDLGRVGPTEPDPRVSIVARSDDIGARLSVTHAAFGVDRPFDDYVAAYRRFMDSPAYPDGWDLVARTPAGEAAACCIAWPDPVSRVGNFEPVATHPSFHRQGFATIVLRDGLRRLREAGMRHAVVRTPADNAAALALYRSVGFEPDHEQLAFRRPAVGGR
jgi:ribosomal protein S18 acetylase RimI-like enzyme